MYTTLSLITYLYTRYTWPVQLGCIALKPVAQACCAFKCVDKMVINCVIYTFTSNWIHQAATIHPRRQQRGRSWSDSKQGKNTKVQINIAQRKQVDKGKTRNCAFFFINRKSRAVTWCWRKDDNAMPYIYSYADRPARDAEKKMHKNTSKQVSNLWWGEKGLRLRNFLPTFA